MSGNHLGSRLFPARCLGGDTPFLVEVAPGSAEPALVCPVCGGEAVLIPGGYYTGSSRGPFDVVAVALHTLDLAPEEAAASADALAGALKLGTRAAVQQVLRQDPKLRRLGLDVPLVPHDLVTFVSLLRTLLEAHADSSRASERPPSPAVLTPLSSRSPT